MRPGSSLRIPIPYLKPCSSSSIQKAKRPGWWLLVQSSPRPWHPYQRSSLDARKVGEIFFFFFFHDFFWINCSSGYFQYFFFTNFFSLWSGALFPFLHYALLMWFYIAPILIILILHFSTLEYSKVSEATILFS